MPSADQSGGLGGTQPLPPNAPQAIVSAAVQAGLSAQIVTSRVIIVGSGGELLVYSPAPAALGNLILSVAAVATTDSKGNAVLAGNVSYLTGGQGVALANNGADLTWYTSTGPAGPWSVLGELVPSAIGPSLVMSGFANFGLPTGTCPQSSAGITTVAQLVSALTAAGVLN
jgi:hypothetical protein